ncbi:UPF0415 protein C7orf25 homolog [Arctopsyche grandis]|uniref:UPF0415 protein C7orf25 homolog n=1 Tax=Arctopsyche grandis TaxID=121162 RepID=UPI00406DA023
MADTDVAADLEKKILFGNELADRLLPIVQIDGVYKIRKKIQQEVSFLKKLKSSQFVKKEQLSCSNLRHLSAVVECALRPGVIALSKVFHTNDGNRVSIDVISDNGRIWTKVIARNPRSLSALSHGNASYGARSVLDQAEDYLSCAIQHPCFYQTPQVVFEFVSGIEDVLAMKLQNLGIIVKGELIATESFNVSDNEFSDTDSSETILKNDDKQINIENQITEVDTLNLDVTTMMAYVSNLTNGHCNFVFKQPLLSQQAAWEAQRPVKPDLERLFQGKTLICCEAAWDDFSKIVNILGGPNEKLRTDQLRERLTVMPDDQNGPDDIKRAELKVKGRIRLRSKIVFNFGQRVRALTVSANEGFVRAAKQQGISYAAIIHESRALTEQKEATATVLNVKK